MENIFPHYCTAGPPILNCTQELHLHIAMQKDQCVFLRLQKVLCAHSLQKEQRATPVKTVSTNT